MVLIANSQMGKLLLGRTKVISLVVLKNKWISVKELTDGKLIESPFDNTAYWYLSTVNVNVLSTTVFPTNLGMILLFTYVSVANPSMLGIVGLLIKSL